jgi:hypothetical protein
MTTVTQNQLPTTTPEFPDGPREQLSPGPVTHIEPEDSPSAPPDPELPPAQDSNEPTPRKEGKGVMTTQEKQTKVRGLLEQIQLDVQSKPVFDELVEKVGSLYDRIIQYRTDKREAYRQIGRVINAARPNVSRKYRSELVTLVFLQSDVAKGTLNKACQFAALDPGEVSLISASASHLSWRRVCRILGKLKEQGKFQALLAKHPDIADLSDKEFNAIINPQAEQGEPSTEKTPEEAGRDARRILDNPPDSANAKLPPELETLTTRIVAEGLPWNDRVRILPGGEQGTISIDMTLRSYHEYEEVVTYLAAAIRETAVAAYHEEDLAAVYQEAA